MGLCLASLKCRPMKLYQKGGLLAGEHTAVIFCSADMDVYINVSSFKSYVQGLFERHKLIVATQLTMAILGREGKLLDGRFELLINRERRVSMPSPLPDWLPDSAWANANALKVCNLVGRCSSFPLPISIESCAHALPNAAISSIV